MNILSDNFAWQGFLEDEKAKLRLAAIAVMPLAPTMLPGLRQRLRAMFFPGDLPGYLLKSERLRRDPALAFPWAKTIVMAAAPFAALPPPPAALPRAKSPDAAGMIAGYAARMDYHQHGQALLEQFLTDLRQAAGTEFKAEICVDAKPLAERTLAAAAGLGQIGRNSCVMVANSGSGCFIASALLDLALPAAVGKNAPETPCRACGNRCAAQCPNGAIGDSPADFKTASCRSSLATEKRGMLSGREMQMLGNHIFGCSVCTGACPESNLPADFPLDLEWLLSAPAAEVKRVIAGTPLAYAGATLLRRNALIALGNNGSTAAAALIKTCLRQTNSELLRQTARNVINHA